MAVPQLAYANPFEDVASAVAGFFSGGQASQEVSDLRAVDDPNNLVSDTRSPANASLNLFDYWISDEGAVDKNDPSGWENMGINEGKQFRFSDAGRYDGPDSGSINAWTGKSGRPLTGIVQNKLDENGYPVLEAGNLYQAHMYEGQKNLMTDAQPLSYLFDETNVAGKRAYRDVRGMVQYVDGYYVYDSTKNYAAYNAEKGGISLFKQPAVSSNSGSILGQFFPFDAGDEVFEERDGSLAPKNIKSTSDNMNHYFGAELTANFVQLPGGTVGGKDIVFDFAGDDDVWVFIDGVLVGDVGGVHGAASLSINFQSGEVVVKDSRKNPPQTYEPIRTTIRDCYETALGTEPAQEYLQEGADTLKDGSYHTLKFFYLERGNTDSNMALTFNLPEMTESKIEKDDQDGEKIAGAEFELWRADENFQPTGAAPLSTARTDANGSFTLMTPDGSRPLDFSELADKGVDHFVLQETKAPDGYRISPYANLRYLPSKGDGLNGFLVSENCFDSGVYARPNQITKVNATGKVRTADIPGKPEQEFAVDENVTVFAVVYKYDRNKTKQWYSVSGSRDNWSVSEKPAGSMDDLNELWTNGSAHVFVPDGDSYAANLGELPGDPRDYKFMAAPGNDDIDYSIGYYLTSMPREKLEAEIAAGKNPLNEGNTFLLDGTGKKGNFIRDSYSSIHVTDIASGITVQKVDDDMTPVNGATFSLYAADQMNADATAPLAGQTPVARGVTSDMSNVESVQLDGALRFSKLAYGTYYLVEEDAPEGYVENKTPVRVICDMEGSFADAGSKGDGVEVLAGVGSLVDAMSLFGSNDQIEVTLHDVIAKKYVASYAPDFDNPNEYHIQQWDPARGDQASADLHLRYNDASRGHDYIPNDEKPNPPASVYFTSDTGMVGAAVFQDREPVSENHGMGFWEDLGGKDITGLFTGSTVIRVTNERVASLEVSKRVDIPEGLLGPENISDKDFPFSFSFSKDGAPLKDEFTARVFKASEQDGALQQVGDDFKIHDGSTHTLKHGETLKVYGLPDGTSYKVEEPASSMPPGFVQTAPHDGNGAPEDAQGTVSPDKVEQRLFVNTYNPIPAEIVQRQLGVEKSFVSADDSEKPWSIPGASFTFVLQQLTQGAPMPDGSQPGVNGLLEKTVVVDSSDKDNAYREFFEPVRFSRQGTYYYNVFERTPSFADRIPGVSYSDAAFIVKVEVTDDRNGKLTASVTAAKTNDDAGQHIGPESVKPDQSGSIVLGFENTLNRTAVSAGPLASKVLTGRDLDSNQTGEFVFRMKPVGEHAESQPMPAGSTGVGADRIMEVRNNGASVGFGQSDYTHDDLAKAPYYYELWEEVPADAVNAQGVSWEQADSEQKEAGGFKKDGVTYDVRHYVAKVSLGTSGDNGEYMRAKIEYFQGAWPGSPDGLVPVPPSGSGDAADKVVFENAYEAEGSFSGIQVAKELLGRDMKADEFRFSIEGIDEASAAKLSEGDKSFGVVDTPEGALCKMGPKLALSFTQGDAGKTFSFIVSEDSVASDGRPLDGVAYDKSVYLVTISVSDNKDGTLRVDPAVLLERDSGGNHRHEPLDLAAIVDPETKLISLDFVNEYGASSAYSGIEVTKTMTGKDMPEGAFVFGIEPKTDAAREKMYIDRDPSVDLSEETLFFAPDCPDGVEVPMGPKLAVDFDISDAGKPFVYEVFEVVDVASDDNADMPGIQNDGVTYDMSKFQVTIDVSDKGNGSLLVSTKVERITDELTGQPLAEAELVGEYTSDEASRIPTVPFSNAYAAAPVETDMQLLTKVIDGRGWMPEDSFTFRFKQTAFHDMNGDTYKPGDDGYIAGPVIPDAVVGMQSENGYFPGTKRFGFSDVSFGAVGMYRYEVGEVVPDDAQNADGVLFGQATDEQKLAGGFKKNGVTYSSEKATVSVSVWDYGNGRLVAVPIVSSIKPDASAHFTNKYDMEDGVVSTAGLFSKKLTGRDWNDSDRFTFEMRAVDPADAPMPDSAIDGTARITLSKENADAAGVVSFGFGDISYTAADLADAETASDGSRSKDFAYEVGEVVPDDAQNADGVLFGQATDEQKLAGGFKKDGVSYDGHKVRFIVTVKDDGKGALSAEHNADASSGNFQFVNDYSLSLDYSTHAGIRIVKTLTGRDMAAGQFGFTVSALDSATVPAAEAAAKMGFAQGSLSRVFETPAASDGESANMDIVPEGLVFDASDAGKVFAYKASETKVGGAGYTNDPTVYDVSISVAIEGADVLVATTTVRDGEGNERQYVCRGDSSEPVVAELLFENSYSAAGQVAIEGSKKLTGRPLVDGEFSFGLSLLPTDGNAGKPAKDMQRVANAADGSIAFAPISFDTATLDALTRDGYAAKSAADTGSSWKLRYRVAEDVSALPGGVSAMLGSFDVDVVLTDDGEGALDAAVTYPQQGGVIENSYSTEGPVSFVVRGTKQLAYEPGLRPNDIAGKFAFTLSSENGAPLPPAPGDTATNDAAGNVTFGSIEFTLDMLADVSPAQDGSRSKTFVYHVRESVVPGADVSGITNDAQADKTFTLTLRDDGMGRLSVLADRVDAPLFSFTNVYGAKPADSSVTDQIRVIKELSGRDLAEGEFEFVLADANNGETIATAKNAADGSVIFPAVSYEKPGEHTYVIFESETGAEGVTYDDAVYVVRTAVSDDGRGSLTVRHDLFTLDGEKAEIAVFENVYEKPVEPVPPVPEKPVEPSDPVDPQTPGGSDGGSHGQSPAGGDSSAVSQGDAFAATGDATFGKVAVCVAIALAAGLVLATGILRRRA